MYNGVAEIEWSEKSQEIRNAIENHARVLKEKVLAQVRALRLMRCLDVSSRRFSGKSGKASSDEGAVVKRYWHGRFTTVVSKDLQT
jgi:hypothetical protein